MPHRSPPQAATRPAAHPRPERHAAPPVQIYPDILPTQYSSTVASYVVVNVNSPSVRHWLSLLPVTLVPAEPVPVGLTSTRRRSAQSRPVEDNGVGGGLRV
jgi:hypothetical protein